MNIDTDSINKLYHFGGEKGRKFMNDEELLKEELEIFELAKSCTLYMIGEIIL
jgi:hypothetical protein